jgi:hypothetical protein
MISKLVSKCWFSRYPRCKYVIYNNGGEFKLHFEVLDLGSYLRLLKRHKYVDDNKNPIMSLAYSMLYECWAHVCTIVRVHRKDKTWEDTASEHGYSIHVLLTSNLYRQHSSL